MRFIKMLFVIGLIGIFALVAMAYLAPKQLSQYFPGIAPTIFRYTGTSEGADPIDSASKAVGSMNESLKKQEETLKKISDP